MPSEEVTNFLGLNLWNPYEYPRREDFVSNNRKIDEFAEKNAIYFGEEEPKASQYIWLKPLTTEILKEDETEILLRLSNNTGDGYYLSTEKESKKIENITENAEEAKPGDIVIMV